MVIRKVGSHKRKLVGIKTGNSYLYTKLTTTETKMLKVLFDFVVGSHYFTSPTKA